MIIYGTNSKLLKEASLNNQSCDHCGEKNMHLSIYSKYAHIFWVPLFPFKKIALMHCGHCQKATEEKELTLEKKTAIANLKASINTPVYMFSGLALIVIFIGFLAYQSNARKNEINSLLTDPAIGDVYTLKDHEEVSEFKYYLWKVVDVVEDSVYISTNSFSYNMKPKKLEPEDGFYDVYYSLHRAELMEMKVNKEIVEVTRVYIASSGFDRMITYSDSYDSLTNE